MIFVNSAAALDGLVTGAAAGAAAAAVNTPEDTEPGVIANFVYQFFVGVFAGIIRFEGWILVILTRIFIGIAKYNGFVNSPAVVTGWTLVRDVANMFFILVMLAIALGTILHIESYNFKRLLPKVLIMAVLVNFSRTICGLAIDFAQVIMMTFAVGFASIVGAGDLMATLHITEMLNASAHLDKDHSIDWSGAFVTGLLAVILLLVAVITVLVMVVVITMRMIMLWLLVVLSPLPFVLTAFPAGQKYAQQWTQEFFKYVIVGPVLAFFLWLSLAVSSTGKLDGMINDNTVTSELSNENLQRGENFTEYTSQQRNTAVFTAIGNPDNFLAFLIGIGMLLGGLMITQQLGVAGGAFAGQMSSAIRQKGLSAILAPAKLGKWGAGLGASALGSRIDRDLAKYSVKNQGLRGRIAGFLSPTVRREGWKQSRADLEREAFPQAVGRMNDYLNKVLHGSDTFNERMAFNTAVTSRQAEIAKVGHSANEHAAMFDEALKSGDRVEAAALGKILVQNNQFDDYTGYLGMDHTPEGLRDHLRETMDRTMGKEASADIGVMWSEFAEATGKMRAANYARTLSYKDKDGKIITRNVWNTEDQAREDLIREGIANPTEEQVRDRYEKTSFGEYKTKSNRTDMEKYMSLMEGKIYAQTYTSGNLPKTINMLDDNLGEFGSAMHRYSNEGMLRAATEDDTRQSDIMESRRNKMQARFKEVLGLSYDEEGNERLDIETLADLFRAGKHKLAVGGLAFMTKNTDKLPLIQETLKAMGVKGPDGQELDFRKIAKKNALAEISPKFTDEAVAKAKAKVASSQEIQNMAQGYRDETARRNDFFYRKEHAPATAAQGQPAAGTQPTPAPAPSGPKPNADPEATWNKLSKKERDAFEKQAKSPAGQKARGNKGVTPYAKELAHQAHLEEFRQKQLGAVQAKETEIRTKAGGNAAAQEEVVRQAPKDMEELTSKISSAIETGMDTSGIITALHGLGNIMESVKGSMSNVTGNKLDLSEMDGVLSEIRSHEQSGGSNLGDPNSVKDLLFKINQSIKRLSEESIKSSKPNNTP